MNREVIKNYIYQHKQETRVIFINIHQLNQIHKETIIEEENQTREELAIFSNNQIVYMKDAKSKSNQ